MNPIRVLMFCALVTGLGSTFAQPAAAQGLIWSLPEPGAWVRYEGTYRQTVYRPEDGQPDTPLRAMELPPVTRHLTIRSLQTETITVQESRQVEVIETFEVDGNQRTRPVVKTEIVQVEKRARWLEFEVVTGKERDGQIDPGLTGRRVYKILVPEDRIIGQTHDDDGVQVSFLPIIDGYRALGDAEPEKIESGAFQMSPIISMVRFFREIEPGEEEMLDLGGEIGTIPATPMTALETIERTDSRVEYDARLWRSDQIPFGLAKWNIQVTESRKDARAPRDDFETVSETSIEMTAVERGSDAESALNVP